jgi:oligopeptide transport system ATP-binding protein
VGTLLSVRDLVVRFKTEDGIVNAVNGVSFDMAEGEALGIVGESGSGKSVTALSIMRLIPTPPGQIASGTIVFEGQNLLALSDDEMRRVRGRRIAMIFQDPMTSLNPVLTINRQITEALELHLRLTPKQARQRAIELLQMVGIPDAARRVDDYPHQFSGGMRQRVMIAMALACSPTLLIADEPTTALDVTIQAQILALVTRLRRELGMAIIWITHDLGIVAGLCDRVVVMYAGQIVETAPVDRLYQAPRHPYTLGLLRSIPRLDHSTRERLVPIDGVPPDPIHLPPGCPFEPRCPYRIATCAERNPRLEPIGPNHSIACWVDVSAASVSHGV